MIMSHHPLVQPVITQDGTCQKVYTVYIECMLCVLTCVGLCCVCVCVCAYMCICLYCVFLFVACVLCMLRVCSC